MYAVINGSLIKQGRDPCFPMTSTYRVSRVCEFTQHRST